MAARVYDKFDNWLYFTDQYCHLKFKLFHQPSIMQSIIVDKYILTMRRCEELLNQRDEYSKLYALGFVDSLEEAGIVLLNNYIVSIQTNNDELKRKNVQDFKEEINRMYEFLDNIYGEIPQMYDDEIEEVVSRYKNRI